MKKTCGSRQYSTSQAGGFKNTSLYRSHELMEELKEKYSLTDRDIIEFDEQAAMASEKREKMLKRQRAQTQYGGDDGDCGCGEVKY
jgi:hypothetical protein